MTNTTQNKTRTPWVKWLFILAILALVTVVIWRLNHANANGNAMGPGPGGPPGKGSSSTTIVHAGQASQADVPVYVTAPGTVVPNASVTVTSRIDGHLEKVYFTEGQYVKAGQLLAQIDDREYQATLAQYQGSLVEHQAQLKSAEATLARYRKLYAQDSLARQDLDTQIATVGQYRGAIQQDQAQIKGAQVSISYSRITAPVSGRVGLRLVDAGNMVHSSDTTGIVTITQMQPAGVTFSVPQSYVRSLNKVLNQGQALPATAFDQDGTTELAKGEVRYISNTIDSTTGTIEMKAKFPNEDEALYANQFVNLRLQTETLHNAVVVPAQGVQLSSDGSFVFVINADNSVTRRKVSAGPLFGTDKQVILSGVKANERIVTEGIDRLTDGSKVSVADNSNSDQPQANSSDEKSAPAAKSSQDKAAK